MKTIDIYSKGNFPGNALSNFANHSFEFDGVYILSMESFLQSLKTRDITTQIKTCALPPQQAWEIGQTYDWKSEGKLFWAGQEYNRFSDDYQNLISRAYDTMIDKNRQFSFALLATESSKLLHSIGKSDKSDTILTEQEFCDILTYKRDALLNQTLDWGICNIPKDLLEIAESFNQKTDYEIVLYSQNGKFIDKYTKMMNIIENYVKTQINEEKADERLITATLNLACYYDQLELYDLAKELYDKVNIMVNTISSKNYTMHYVMFFAYHLMLVEKQKRGPER